MDYMVKNRISEIRKAKGIGLEELAERSGLSPGYVSLMASGGRNISLKNLEKLATALGCQPSDLIADDSLGADIAAIWAAIPPERRELAKSVLESFASKRQLEGIDDGSTGGVKSKPGGSKK